MPYGKSLTSLCTYFFIVPPPLKLSQDVTRKPVVVLFVIYTRVFLSSRWVKSYLITLASVTPFRCHVSCKLGLIFLFLRVRVKRMEVLEGLPAFSATNCTGGSNSAFSDRFSRHLYMQSSQPRGQKFGTWELKMILTPVALTSLLWNTFSFQHHHPTFCCLSFCHLASAVCLCNFLWPAVWWWCWEILQIIH